ncbi:MAG: hypothetical protein B6I38_09455, partial [Anaerolineaceae bacterium 4572_5.1]
MLNAFADYWPKKPSEKVKRYIGKFYDCTRLGAKISGKVEGNHGTYTVTISLRENRLSSACSCYIGKRGNCHHCVALAKTFAKKPLSFQELATRKLEEVKSMADLEIYLKSETLGDLLAQLKSKGITQKAFAESIGMNTRHLSSIKSSELRNRFYNELGATKLAVL